MWARGRTAGQPNVSAALSGRPQAAHRRAAAEYRVADDGASGKGGLSGQHAAGWRDAMDIVVKWRQFAEPNDQVIAVPRLLAWHGSRAIYPTMQV